MFHTFLLNVILFSACAVGSIFAPILQPRITKMLILQAARCAANIGRHGRIQYCNLFTERRFKSSSKEPGCSIGSHFEHFLPYFRARGALVASSAYTQIRDLQKTAGFPMEVTGGTSAQAPRDSGYIGIYIYIRHCASKAHRACLIQCQILKAF